MEKAGRVWVLLGRKISSPSKGEEEDMPGTVTEWEEPSRVGGVLVDTTLHLLAQLLDGFSCCQLKLFPE